MTTEFMTAYCNYIKNATPVDESKFPEIKGYTPAPADVADFLNHDGNGKIKVWADSYMKKLRKMAMKARIADILKPVTKENPDENAVTDVFKEFIESPCYTFDAVYQDKDGVWAVKERSGYIGFDTLEKEYQLIKSVDTDENGNPRPNTSVTIAANKQWQVFVACYLHSLQRKNAEEVGSALTIKNSPCEENFRKENGFTSLSKKTLRDNLVTVMSQIIPASLIPCFRTKDVAYLLSCTDTAKNGTIKVITEKALIRELFVATQKATNGSDYERISKARIYSENKKG